MSKLFSLLVCLLSLTIFVSAQTSNRCRSCVVTLTSAAPPPVCEDVWIPVEEGEDICEEEEEVCTEVGPAVQSWKLNQKNSYAWTNFPVQQLEFSGFCECEWKAFTGADLRGSWKWAWFSRRSYRKVVLADVWSRNATSVEVTCKF